MGRKKIAITRIQDERNRQITFSKRKAGLLKKAYELSILCDVEIAVVMITSNSKLYQYASTNMNSILIRYTEFKDPDESKTNADILEDITKKERGGGAAHDDSGDEEDAPPPPHHQFLLTPRTHAQFRKIDEEFDHMLRQNQLQAMPAPLHSGGPVPQVPNAMPVSVPVTQSPGTIQQQIHQHLQQQLELRSSSSASTSSSVLGSASSIGFISPQSDLSSASPATSKGQKSPGSMPPPVNTPTRLQTLRNQTLKLHLPGSGRNYISLTPGGGGGGEGTSPNKKGTQGGDGGEKGEEGAGGAGEGGGSKPQLRVYIPGQKEFVPRTQATSPLPQVGGLSVPGGQPGAATQVSTSSESLTTPILSLATPNMFSNLPPLFSSFMGEFPFGPSASATAAASGGGSDLHSSASALVAFPVSIQPSSVSSSSSATGNIILQAQNMGQPFLLTPNYDPSRQNPLFGSPSSSFTPPTTLPAISPSLKDLEQLKHQYEKVQQQLLQQQLFLSQTFQQQAKDSAAVGSTSQASTSPRLPVPPHPPPSSHSQEKDSGLGGPQAAAVSQASRFSGVLMTSQSETATLPVSGVDTEPSAPKRPRLQAPSASSF